MKVLPSEKKEIEEKRKHDISLMKDAKKMYINRDHALNDIKGFIEFILFWTGLSHRRIQELIGQSSTGFIANILSGQKRLTNKHAVNLANLCSMNNKEKAIFYEAVLLKGEL